MLKKMFLAMVAVLGLSQSVSAAVLTEAQTTAVTGAITSGIGEYIAFILAVIVITYPATLIIRSLRGIGKGRAS